MERLWRALSLGSLFLAVVLPNYSMGLGPIDDLPGKWTGNGRLVFESGDQEAVKCITTYVVNGRNINQNIRCASTSYSISVSAVLKVSGDKIEGQWQEANYNSNGQVEGLITNDGFEVDISGDKFTAQMTIETEEGFQRVQIIPVGLILKKVTIVLAKD